MDSTVIVALPAVDDHVMKISSEKVPHLTMVFMPPASAIDNLEELMLYVQHAASELSPFYLTVDYRGELGPDSADVLFFEDTAWDMKRVKSFRHHLLLNDNIRKAYDSIEQYPEWTPHLTLGFPETPANEDDRDYGIHSVQFDRIAVWTGDYEGVEFRLRYSDTAADIAMSDISTTDRGAAAVNEMFHYGTKGMRWGIRKDRATSRGGADSGPTAVVVTQKKPGKFAKTKGGEAFPAHEDSLSALVTRQVAKKSTTDALSNAELKLAVERMQLETRYNQLEFSSDRRSRGLRFVQGLIGHRKPTKYRDMDEEIGEETRKAVKKAIALRMAAAAATPAT